MDIEYFRVIKEIQSLNLKIFDHLKNIDDEKARINYLETKSDESKKSLKIFQDEKRELTKKLTSLEEEHFEKEKNLSKAKDNLALASDMNQQNAITKQIENLTPVVESLEEEILITLENIETLDENILDKTTFLDELEETQFETHQEVETKCNEENKEVNTLEQRVSGLLNELTETDKQLIKNTISKFPKRDFLTRANSQKKCDKCKFTLDAQTYSSISELKSIELCTSCKRVMIPENV